MSTAETETRTGELSGNCFRCTKPGHWHDDPACPLLQKARTLAEHENRIREYGRRYSDNELTRRQKTAFIIEENAKWKRSST